MMAIRECRNSGLSVRAWRQQQGITPTTYYRWEQEVLSLAGDAAELSGREFVELPAVEQGIITVYQMWRKAAAFRHGDISHTLFPRIWHYRVALVSVE